ncbi:MAG: OPT family oligopeptide transporter [Myxococcales bacterium]|nr:MAG: OPT family oligopeptide transporter [Myxococcales bacterium]
MQGGRAMQELSSHAANSFCIMAHSNYARGREPYMPELKRLMTADDVKDLSPEERERWWYENVYTGMGDSMKQLTWRAVLMGALLGSFMSLSNLYIGLKTGWGLGVAITASILSYTIWTTFYKVGLVKSKMTILENNCMQSTASAAGYSTGGTLISAIAAYMLVNNASISTNILLAWVFFLAILGVTLAIPMKRQMINIEQLKFPSGVAAAETLRALHSEQGSGLSAAKALGVAGVLGAIVALLRDLFEWLPGQIDAFGKRMADLTVSVEVSPMMVAAGAIMGLRVCWSMLLGGFINYVLIVPVMLDRGVIHDVGYREIVKWSLWGGAACMVTSALLSFGLQWRTAMRAFSGVTNLILRRNDKPKVKDPMEEIEVPGSWFIWGAIVGGVGVVAIIAWFFGTPAWMGVLAVVMSFFLALVACRVAGETDTTPVGAMGKITQLFYGAIAPRQMNTNLMTACITAGVADSASDLLYDLKSGYLLGANPRKQFLAQMAGIFPGTLISVYSFQYVVHSAEVLGSDKFPAPAAQTWAGVAKLLGQGLEFLDPTMRWAILIGAVVGVALPVMERLFPKARAFIPSAMGLGLSFTIPFWNSLSFFIGGLIGWIIEKKRPKIAEDYTIPVASGVVAGESLTGVGVTIYQNVIAGG